MNDQRVKQHHMKVHDKEHTGKNLADLAAQVFNKQVDTAVITSIPAQEGSGLVNHSPPPSSKNQKEMIDPKSLRIGNYIQVDGKIVPIHELLNDYAVVRLDLDSPILSPAYPCISYKKISGIPLSEQELIRLGFEKIKDEDGEWHYFKYPIALYKFGGLNGDKEYFIMYEPDVQFHFVHDLQNLFHAITGTELTYKVENETIKP